MKIFVGTMIALMALASSAQAQGCYGGVYQQPVALATNFCTQTVTQTVQVPVTVSVPVAIQHTVAVPTCTAVAAAPLAAPTCGAVGIPLAQSYGMSFGLGVYGGVGLGVGGYSGFGANRFAVANRFAGVNNLAVAGQGVSVSARDRRGTQVVATGANSVRIERGLLGRIKGARADANRGLLGRINPF